MNLRQFALNMFHHLHTMYPFHVLSISLTPTPSQLRYRGFTLFTLTMSEAVSMVFFLLREETHTHDATTILHLN